ncbi:MAG: histidine kinase dimerization/phospho-acceptor domain-containing protein, partial [Thermoanaerobaculia bacterium]
MTPREQALYLLAGKVPSGSFFFQTAAQALATGTGCRWAGIGELGEDGKSVSVLALWDGDHQAETFSFQLHGSPCLQVYQSDPDNPHAFFPCDVAAQFAEFPLLSQLGARSYRGEVFYDAAERPVGHVFVMSEKDEEDEAGVRDFFRLVAQRVGAEYNRWKLSGLVEERTAEVEERGRLLRQLEAKNAEIQSKSEEMERFTYAVSHDLKSPLLTITGFVGMLERDLESDSAERVETDLGKIRNAAARMQQLIDELSELSKLGRLDTTSLEVPLAELAREAVDLVGGQIAERRVEVEVSPDLPVVSGDRTRLLQVFQNLIDNAVKFIGEQSEPRIVSASRKDSEPAVCYVQDTGNGIDTR